MTKAVARQEFSREDLTNLTTFDSAVALIEERGLAVVTEIPDAGDGYNDTPKSDLVGVPFLILTWEFRDGDIEKDDGSGKGQYVAVRGITSDNRKFYFPDGSELGIYDQLRRAEVDNVSPPMLCKWGLDFITIKSRANKRSYRIATGPRSDKDV